MSRMYPENRKSLNWFVGCNHDCVYCKPSFQRQAKRQKQRCLKCYSYEPHGHLDRLLKTPPKTNADEFIFFPSSGDPAYATTEQWRKAIDYTAKYSPISIRRTFLIQSKDPYCFIQYKFPDNVILGTTIETDLIWFGKNPSSYVQYQEVSCAPLPAHRVDAMLLLKHNRKLVTVEPILMFSKTLAKWIKAINPEITYVGYDNHNCNLPEPKLAKTQLLIRELKKFTEVRVKTLRKAWYEK